MVKSLKNLMKFLSGNPQELFLEAISPPSGEEKQILFLLDKKSPEIIDTPSIQSISFSEKDLRLVSLGQENRDGIWWENASARYALEDNQRILALLFQALRPKTGILAISFEEPPWTMNALDSQMKQSGFRILKVLKSDPRCFLLARRI